MCCYLPHFPIDSKPSVNDPILLDVIKKVSFKWHLLGLRLGQDLGELDNYGKESFSDYCTCCVRVFSHWIGNDGYPPDYPLSWEGVYNVLVAIDQSGVAEKMKKELAKKGYT